MTVDKNFLYLHIGLPLITQRRINDALRTLKHCVCCKLRRRFVGACLNLSIALKRRGSIWSLVVVVKSSTEGIAVTSRGGKEMIFGSGKEGKESYSLNYYS